MTQAYNIEWIKNVRIRQAAESWQEKQLITEEQLRTIKSEFPVHFYNPGIFVKIGLFLFCSVACLFFSGLMSLFLLGASAGEGGISLVSIVSALGFIAMLEFLIRDRKLFHSGIDNALLYAALGAAMVPFFMLVSDPPVWPSCCYAFVLLVVAFIRYADLFTVIAGFCVLIVLVANIMMQFSLGKALLPFAVMLLSALIYFTNKKLESDYYYDAQVIISALCLATFYLGGNYYIVREGNAALNDFGGTFSPQIPFAPLFYCFTVAIPACYVFGGLRKKDRSLLIIGLLSFAFSVFTFRYYFVFLPLELGLAIAGILMIVTSALVIHYLKTPKHGLTDEKEGEGHFRNLQVLIAAQQLGQTPIEKGVSFGGGNFGGGGAGNDY